MHPSVGNPVATERQGKMTVSSYSFVRDICYRVKTRKQPFIAVVKKFELLVYQTQNCSSSLHRPPAIVRLLSPVLYRKRKKVSHRKHNLMRLT